MDKEGPMLHIHFGTGRLGLGLVAPFLQSPNSELFLLNRASSGKNATGSSSLHPSRRNELLKNSSRRQYMVDTPGVIPGKDGREPRENVYYDGFYSFEADRVQHAIRDILANSEEKDKGIVVTASVLTADNYAPVVEALNVLCSMKESDNNAIGDVYLIACENTVSAGDVLTHKDLTARIREETYRHARCVHALVDRVCVGMEECSFLGEPSVLVHAEEYGSLKLQLCSNTEKLPELLRGTRAEFSRYLDVEKDIKSWLLNGSHWLIALTAFQETGGDAALKLNEFIMSTEDHELYSSEIVNEMRDGVEALLRSDPQYANFVRDVDVSAYLDGAASCILERFKCNEDTIMRILARFRAPSRDEVTSIQSFVDRFLHRIEPPLVAYQALKGVPAKSATQGIFNLFRLQASGTYVDTVNLHKDVA